MAFDGAEWPAAGRCHPSLDPRFPPFLSLPEDLVGEIMSHFSTAEGRQLRLVCSAARDAVRDYRWEELSTCITGPLSAWRACFPRARAANVRNRKDLTDADFVHFEGLRALNMWECSQPSITDARITQLPVVCTHCEIRRS
jgi:hypothetical protein